MFALLRLPVLEDIYFMLRLRINKE